MLEQRLAQGQVPFTQEDWSTASSSCAGTTRFACPQENRRKGQRQRIGESEWK